MFFFKAVEGELIIGEAYKHSGWKTIYYVQGGRGGVGALELARGKGGKEMQKG